MKRFFPILCLLVVLLAGVARAGTIVTATVTVTNTAGTTNGQTITVNGDLRTWTNSVPFPSSQILTNNSIGGCATNLYLAAAAYPFVNLSLAQLTNGITLLTAPNAGVTVTLSPGWGLVVYSTNQLQTAITLRLPITVEISTVQTNLATQIAQALESCTYGLSSNAPFFTNITLLIEQATLTISGNRVFTGTNIYTNVYSIWYGGTISNALAISGTVARLTNGLWFAATLSSPIMTNGVNYGNAFSSPGSGGFSEQFGAFSSASGFLSSAFGNSAFAIFASATAIGAGSQATNFQSTALGSGALSGGSSSIALGASSTALGSNAVAVGNSAQANGTNSTALGTLTSASGLNSTAVGDAATAAFDNSTAIGQGATTTAANQNVIGNSSQSTIIPGGLQAGTISNAVFGSTNNFPKGSDIAFGRFALSSIANGNNAGVVVGTNVFAEISGPTGVFTINGIAGGRDGKAVILLNRTTQNMTIAHDSGVDPTAANRIYCLTAADKTITGNSAALLIYSSNVSRWIVLNFSQ
jgi:hypothetical protein